ncbi:MAG: DUF6183 family protein, partial [Myxococcales bacterium]
MEPSAFIASLKGARDVRQQFADVDRAAAGGGAEALLDVHARLRSPIEGVPEWARDALARRIESALALIPSRDNLEAVLRLVAPLEPDAAGIARVRLLAAMLAQGQLPTELFDVMTRDGGSEPALELLACVLHELVARGMDCTGVPEAEALQARLSRRRHLLAWLPLTRFELERDSGTRTFSLAGCGSPGPVESDAEPLAARALGARTIEPLDDARALRRLTEAVRGWEEASNGSVEAALFRVTPALVDREGLVALLPTLPLSCTARADWDRTQVRPSSPEQTFARLFAAAAFGGA